MMKTQKAPSTARGHVWALPREWAMTSKKDLFRRDPCAFQAQEQLGAGG